MRSILVTLLLSVALATSCQQGGILTTSSSCLYPSYIEGCYTYASQNTCKQCEYNYKLTNGRCYYYPINGSDCCLGFDSNSGCTQCANGLLSNTASATCHDVKIYGCIKKGKTGCQMCTQAYELIGGKCVKDVDQCTQYNQQGSCQACQSGYLLNSGSCVPQIQIQPIPNCKQVTEYGCGQCDSGYRIDAQGKCQSSMPGCLIHNPDGSCKQCLAPHYELAQGKCQIVGCTSYQGSACTCCDTSLGFRLTNGVCEIDNCIYFTNKGCSLCKNNWSAGSWGCRQPEGKVCLICKSDQYLGADNKCHKKDMYCTKYQQGVCVSCCENYYLDSDRACKPVLPGCVYQNYQCVSCTAPFQYYQGQCLIDGCLKYNKNGCVACDSRLKLFNCVCGLPNCKTIANYQCKECVSGYQLDQKGECIIVDPYCTVRNSANQCLQCKDGYRLNINGICSTMKFGCNYVDGRCTSCRAPFTYVPSTESCEIDGCLEYFLGGCSKCASDYSLLYNTCKLPNCLISKNGKCLECDPDYIFRSDGKCVSKDEFCQKMDEYGTCIKCMDSYFYSAKQQKCIKKAPGCQYDSQDNCISCIKPFTYEPGRCIIKGCLRFDSKGCYECNYPYSLTQNNTCTIAHCNGYSNDGRCMSCETGYTLSADKLCELQDEYCADYNPTRSACQKCIKGYYVDHNGRCQYSDSHCDMFDDTGICINCDRLYFLNYYGKCQLRDPQCLIYTNGLCSHCRPYFFPRNGYCMANLAGCKQQKSYDQCLACEDGYQLSNGQCKAAIKKLTWNDIDMDFWGDENECDKQASKAVFTVGVDSKLNLVPVMSTNKSEVYYSSSALNGASFLLSGTGNNGWSPSGSCQGQWVGVKTTSLETFYAIDIKHLSGSALKSFYLQYSADGFFYDKITDFTVGSITVGAISTYYFKAVYAKFIRLVVKEGTPNIRFEFYVSSNNITSHAASTDSYIGKTVTAVIDGAEEGGISACKDDGLCWAGVESCEPRKIKGFSLVYNQGCNDRVSEVKIEYSTDGLNFQCYKNCSSIALSGNSLTFPEALLAQKLHVHFSKYSGAPKFGVKFDFL